MINDNKEYIACSAIWYKELPTMTYLPINIDKGVVVCGYRHAHCINVMSILANLRTVTFAVDGVGEHEQGFLTSKNRFLNREDAYTLAEQANQLNNRPHNKGCLYSEDIYGNY